MPELLHEDYSVKIISIVRSTVAPKALMGLNKFMVFQDLDARLQEDLYSLEDAEPGTLHPDLEEIRQLCNKHEAAYFRLVKM